LTVSAGHTARNEKCAEQVVVSRSEREVQLLPEAGRDDGVNRVPTRLAIRITRVKSLAPCEAVSKGIDLE
jgi:hypothetical protein